MTTPATHGVAEALAALVATMPDPTGTARTQRLEAGLAARFGVSHAVAVASGTAALHTALVAAGIQPGDDVLVPALSVVMSVAPVLYAGARPVFVDAGPTGDDFDYDDLAAKYTERTTAVMPVYLWGRSGDPTRLVEFARQRRIRIIEDACQAHASTFQGRPLGTFGDLGCFSMKDGKILWSGEGGFILTNDPDLAATCRAFRTHWQTPSPGQPPYAHLGHNYRLAEPLAVLAHTNLANLDALAQRRLDQTRRLVDLLRDTPGLTPPQPRDAEHWNGYTALLTIGLNNPREFCQQLARRGVPNSVGSFGLIGCERRAPFATYQPKPCPHANAVIDSTLAVALTEHDTDQQIDTYARIIEEEARQWSRRDT